MYDPIADLSPFASLMNAFCSWLSPYSLGGACGINLPAGLYLAEHPFSFFSRQHSRDEAHSIGDELYQTRAKGHAPRA